MTDLRRPPRLRRIRAGLGEQQPDQTETANGDRRETPKRDTATEMIHHVARERGAERGADTYCAPYDAKPQVEPSRAAHDVRDDERENHPENGGADAIEGRSTRFIPSPSRHSIPRSGFGRYVGRR